MKQPDVFRKLTLAAFIAILALVVITGTAWGVRLYMASHTQPVPQPSNYAVSGFPLKGDPAPDFSLVDQFGKPVTLSSFRGQEVVLAFIDSQCKSLCPLTANIMYNAKARLGTSAANHVALVAINANPAAPSVAEVQSWSIAHGMLHQWLFLTGSPDQLQSIYRQYKIYAQVDANGNDVHDPAVFIIDANGRERLYFETLDSNSQADLNSEVAGMEAGMRQWLPQT
jgi:cytochrome oxidase Cu insertion factor (SCO1/SenC/PrrC family)